VPLQIEWSVELLAANFANMIARSTVNRFNVLLQKNYIQKTFVTYITFDQVFILVTDVVLH